ncbi:MAG TPA: HAD family phosphatase [Anaerolineales bacterium]|jgi:beta-phosphoglucomutase
MPELSQKNFTACIFDFDGVIIDSEPLHAEAKRLTLEHFQIHAPENTLMSFKGRTDADFFGYIAADFTPGSHTAQELDAYKRQQYLLLFDNVPLVPGGLDFIRSAREKFSRLGLATSANNRDFSLAMRKFHLENWFDVIVTGESTRLHKPHPEPYLKALELMCASAAETLVIEDSPNGISAAKAAGCTVAAITTTFSAVEIAATGADFIGENFIDLGRMLGIP